MCNPTHLRLFNQVNVIEGFLHFAEAIAEVGGITTPHLTVLSKALNCMLKLVLKRDRTFGFLLLFRF